MNFQAKTNEILLLEDNATSAERRTLPGVGTGEAAATVTVRVHRLSGDRRSIVARATYEAGSMQSKNGARIELIGQLLRRAVARSVKPIIVAGTSYGSAASFLALLCDGSLPFVVQIRPSTQVTLAARKGPAMPASKALSSAEWRQVTVTMLDGARLACTAAKLAKVEVPGCTAQLFAAQVGGIDGVHRGTIIGLSSLDVGLTNLVELAALSNWIRREVRNQKRASAPCISVERFGIASMITARANIALARRQDAQEQTGCAAEPARRGILQNAAAVLNVVELFSGAGGMGLGFLLGGGNRKRYRIIFSGEAHPIFAQTLRANHQKYERLVGQISGARTPVEEKTVDLREKRVLESAVAVAKELGGAHFLIGGPPCQGFSIANRNSWSPDNPNNELVNVFITYILKLRPLGFLMENVQGILWTPSANGTVSVVDAIERRLKAAGYVLFPKLLDAVWYGVPQHRTRLFLMGLHRDLGYAADDFGEWGPFPQPTHGRQRRPFVTVRQAISDLPRIGNGHSSDEIKYQTKRMATREIMDFIGISEAEQRKRLFLTTLLRSTRITSSIAIERSLQVEIGKTSVRSLATTRRLRARTAIFIEDCGGTSRRLRLAIIAKACLSILASTVVSPCERPRGCNHSLTGFDLLAPLMELREVSFISNSSSPTQYAHL